MMTTGKARRRAAAVGVAVAGFALGGFLIGTLPDCSSDSSTTASDGGAGEATAYDVRFERIPRDVGTPSVDDASDATTPLACDAGADTTFWPGWQTQGHVSTLSACCPWGTPVDAAASMPPWQWIPCTNGAANCTELATASWAPVPAAIFTNATVSRGSDGSPKWLMFTRGIGAYRSPPAEFDLYDIASGTPLGAWRADDSLATRPYCYVEALLGESTVTLDSWFPNQGVFVANGSPASMTSDPSLQRFSDAVVGVQETLASDRVFAFDLEPQGIIGRTDFGSGTVQQARGTFGLILAMVEGDDVFAISEHGTAGWGQIYTIDANGTLALLRSNASAHVATPTSDGTRIYWTETYGSQDVLAQQTSTELWSAPYTADPATLAATATKLGAIPNTLLPVQAIAFSGLFAILFRSSDVYLGRVSDGRIIQVDPGAPRYFSVLLAATPTELWAIQSAPQAASSSLSRIGLPW
jgi:hypothetical protein